jgi:hypothetical protein
VGSPERAERIGEFWSCPQSRIFAELLIDCEEDGTLWAVLVRTWPDQHPIEWQPRLRKFPSG